MPILNFGRNVTISPRRIYTPRTEQEVLEILDRHRGDRIRCIGRRHSWSRVLESDDILLDMSQLQHVRCSSEQNGPPTVVVGAGCQIRLLLAELKRQRKWTLPSVGFITEQSIAGAISTGTHGSGRHSLSHYVNKVRVARYDQQSGKAIIETIDQGPELKAARCALGCLGVVLEVELPCRPCYQVEESFAEYPDLRSVISQEDAYPLQQFYFVPWRWTYFAQHRREVDAKTSILFHLFQWYRFLVFDLSMHGLILLSAVWLGLSGFVQWLFRWLIPLFVVRNWRVIGPSQQQLVMEHELFRHVEMEIFVPRHRLEDAIDFLKQSMIAASRYQHASEGTYTHHYPVCIRKILSDDTLISMASPTSGKSEESTSDTPWYSITLTNYQRGLARRPFEAWAQSLAEEMIERFEARLHWGKLCPLPPGGLIQFYPEFETFVRICQRFDSVGRFRNAWMDDLMKSTIGTEPPQPHEGHR